MPLALQERKTKQLSKGVMKANVFRAPGLFGLEEKPIPSAGPGEAVVQVRLTTICGTDLHIIRGEYAVEKGLTIGHEAVGVIHELGPGVTGYSLGQRVLVGAITPCGQCEPCLEGHASQCGGALGGWRLGNTMDGAQAEYIRIPHAQANLATIPEALSDEAVLLLADVASTGFAAAENGRIHLGDTVAVFAQGPIGLCATLGAKLMGASQIIAIDNEPARLRMAQGFGATSDNPGGGRCGARNPRAYWGLRRRRRHRSAWRAGDVRERAAGAEARRHAFQRGRIFRASANPRGRFPRRACRSNRDYHIVPRREGAHASPDAFGGSAPHRPDAAVNACVSARRDRSRLRTFRFAQKGRPQSRHQGVLRAALSL